MSEPFIGEIKIFPYSFAPVGWAYCNGATMNISQNPALFSIIQAFFGGDGINNFMLPNLKNRVPLGVSDTYRLGADYGSSQVTLTTDQIPRHNHQMAATGETGDINLCDNQAMLAKVSGRGNKIYSENTDTLVSLNSAALTSTGNTQPHENMQPFLSLNFFIALEGIYPPRS